MKDHESLDNLTCYCGNETHTSGFAPCLRTGQVVEATEAEWTDGELYRCMWCGLIIETDTIAEVARPIGVARDAVSHPAWKLALEAMEAELLADDPLAFTQIEWDQLAAMRAAIAGAA